MGENTVWPRYATTLRSSGTVKPSVSGMRPSMRSRCTQLVAVLLLIANNTSRSFKFLHSSSNQPHFRSDSLSAFLMALLVVRPVCRMSFFRSSSWSLMSLSGAPPSVSVLFRRAVSTPTSTPARDSERMSEETSAKMLTSELRCALPAFAAASPAGPRACWSANAASRSLVSQAPACERVWSFSAKPTIARSLMTLIGVTEAFKLAWPYS
mmetsp:Transcript_48123/g.111435  ORF Transcript_48123/g.111435 Transcript_48123/m.111435 type:complete len:210 (-) Transcript_48123:461-1090(-)